MPTIVDELVVLLGLDPSGFQKGRSDSKAALDQMRTEAQQAQTALDALQAKSARQKRADAAEDRRIADQIAAIKRNSTSQTKAEDEKQVKSLQSQLAAHRSASRERKAQTADQIDEQKKIYDAKRRGIKDTEKGEKEQLQQTRQRTQASREEGSAVSALTSRVIGLFAAFTAGAGVADFIKNTIGGAAATGRLADNLGVDIEALGAWEGAVRRVGGEAKDADGAIASLVKTRELLAAGQLPGDQAKVLNSFGITKQDLDDPIATMTKLADKAKTMSKAQFSLRLGMLGFDQNAINALENGGEALRKLMDEARKAGVTTRELSDKSKKAQEAWVNMKDASAKLGQNILVALLPAMVKVTDWLTKLAEWMQGHMGIATALVTGLAGALVALSVISFAGLITGLGGVLGAVGAIGLAVGSVTALLIAMDGALADREARLHARGEKGYVGDSGGAIPGATSADDAFAQKALADQRKNVADQQKAFDEAKAEYSRLKKAHDALPWYKKASDWLFGDDAIKKAKDETDTRARTLARAKETLSGLESAAPASSASTAPNAGGSGGGVASTNQYNTVVGNGRYGTPGRNLTDMTMGEVQDFGRNVLIPKTKAAGVGRDSRGVLGSSASGAYQITGTTMERYASHMFGPNWRSMKFDATTQDRIAEAIFNDNKGSAAALKGQWASLSLAEAERVRNMAWPEARKVILAGETGNGRSSTGSANPLPPVSRTAPASRPVIPRTAPIRRNASGEPTGPYPTRDRGRNVRAMQLPDGEPTGPYPTSSEPRQGGGVVATMGDAASRLIVAAQSLMAAAAALHGNQPVSSRRQGFSGNVVPLNIPASYDRGLSVGASVSYAHHVTSNDNSSRVEATTHIGQITVAAGGNAGAIAGGLEKAIKARSMAINAASGLF